MDELTWLGEPVRRYKVTAKQKPEEELYTADSDRLPETLSDILVLSESSIQLGSEQAGTEEMEPTDYLDLAEATGPQIEKPTTETKPAKLVLNDYL